jgi:hypothetical protein
VKLNSSGLHKLNIRTRVNEGSSVTLTATQSGSASASISVGPPAANQVVLSLIGTFNTVAGDVITVTVASSNPIDKQLNSVHTNISIGTGLV